MQLPTIPTFVTGDTSLQKLQQLSQAVSMCSVASNYPLWRFYKNITQVLTANAWNPVHCTVIAIDTDGVFTTADGSATIVTQGYYECEGCVPFAGQASSFLTQANFMFTAGPNNPHYTSGSQVFFGGVASWAGYTASGVDAVVGTAGKCPYVCYPGDNLALRTYALGAMTINSGQNGSATAGWFTPQFSGRWIRSGS
jgi:hypothetical protein